MLHDSDKGPRTPLLAAPWGTPPHRLRYRDGGLSEPMTTETAAGAVPTVSG